jgi:hypothetical protein
MKTDITCIGVFCSLFCGVVELHSQGYIVPNGVSYGGYEPGFGYKISVVDNPAGVQSIFSTSTQFGLNPIGMTQPTAYTNTFSIMLLTDIQVRLFLVSFNDPISLPAIQSQSYSELTAPTVFQSGVPFYLALYTGYQFAPPYPPTHPYNYLGPVLGWVELVNNQGAIQMLGSGLEYSGDGIFAGTQNIIQPAPEPGTLGLFALGGLIFSLHRRRKHAFRSGAVPANFPRS